MKHNPSSETSLHDDQAKQNKQQAYMYAYTGERKRAKAKRLPANPAAKQEISYRERESMDERLKKPPCILAFPRLPPQHCNPVAFVAGGTARAKTPQPQVRLYG